MERNDDKPRLISRLDTALAIAAGFSFYVLCMIFSMVGPAGSRVAHAAKNKATFMAVLLLTLALAAASVYANLKRRRTEGGARLRFPAVLCILCALIFLIALFDGFAI